MIQGGDVTVKAQAELDVTFGGGDLVRDLIEVLGLSVLAGVVRPKADATITVNGGSIDAANLTALLPLCWSTTI